MISYTNPEFRKPNSNLSWTPQTAPAQNLVQNPMWYNVNFALVPTTDLGIEIIDFNNTDKPAIILYLLNQYELRRQQLLVYQYY